MNILISVGEHSCPQNYIRAVEQAGGRPHPVYLPDSHAGYAGLILAGGGDVDPAVYGCENRGSIGIDLARDQAELRLLDAFLSSGRPVLGICRGHQVANVWAGGTLIQDLGQGNLTHRGGECDRIHSVTCLEGSLLSGLYATRLTVNSSHHQAVDEPGRGLRVTARSEDGVVEAMEHESLPLLTVQFHPERMVGADTAPGSVLLRWFLARCK